MIPGDAAQEALRPADLVGGPEEGRRGFDSRPQAGEAAAQKADVAAAYFVVVTHTPPLLTRWRRSAKDLMQPIKSAN